MAGLPPVSKAHVDEAIRRVVREGVPERRGPKKFCLVIGRSHLPPKYTLGIAVQHAIGRAPRPDEFSGGNQTNSVLRNLGFEVRPCRCGGKVASAPQRASPGRRSPPSPGEPSAPKTAASMPIVRLVTNGQPPEIPRAAERMMLTALGPRWPTNVRAKFLITPGGFVVARWPQGLEPRTGWQSRPSDLAGVTRHAAEVLKKVVTPRVLDAAKARAAILTIGIDVVGGPGGAMAELVAVFDVSRGQLVRWTGKSYPTPGRQERDLVHVADLKSHLLKVVGERVLVLGCHDLNMFSRRAHANQAPTGPRRQRCDAMRSEVARFEPTVVLQHPHTTDTPNIWRATWMTLAKEVPSAKSWASGIAYFNWGKARRARLDRVLSLTRSDAEHVRDIVLQSSNVS